MRISKNEKGCFFVYGNSYFAPSLSNHRKVHSSVEEKQRKRKKRLFNHVGNYIRVWIIKINTAWNLKIKNILDETLSESTKLNVEFFIIFAFKIRECNKNVKFCNQWLVTRQNCRMQSLKILITFKLSSH